ncbi:MAG: hypothetical protein EON47_10720, partial [Acetobacteraceae bacterium]
LSGANRPLGQAMLNAAQLALFDQADPGIEFLPRDTGSTPAGAAEAARSALGEGARALAGPLTLTETAAAAGPARAARRGGRRPARGGVARRGLRGTGDEGQEQGQQAQAYRNPPLRVTPGAGGGTGWRRNA